MFLEKEFVSKGASGSKVELEEVLPKSNTEQVTEAVAEEVPQEIVEQPAATTTQAPRRSGKIRHQPERYGLFMTKDNDVLLIEKMKPATYAEAVAGPDSE